MVEFCPECNGMLFPKKYEDVFMLECKSCGFYEMLEKAPEFKIKDGIVETTNKKKEKGELGEGAVDKENVFASYEHKCSKCGFDKAEFIDAGVFYSDEDNIYMIKCGNCGAVERVGEMS